MECFLHLEAGTLLRLYERIVTYLINETLANDAFNEAGIRTNYYKKKIS